MKRLSVASLPVRCCTPLMLVGSCILAIAWTFLGFASIPRAETMYPSSFPAGTPNTHFFWVEFDYVLVECCKGFAEVVEYCARAVGFDDNVIDVDLDVSAYLVSQTCLHHLLVRGS